MPRAPWWRIGWRNLGRNRRRTALTAMGLAVGYCSVVFMVGWAGGITAELVENATGLVSGQIEIHDAGYRPDRSLYDTIGGRDGADFEALLNAITADPAVVAAAPRVFSGGLVSSGDATTAGILMGVDPGREAALTRFLDPLVRGRLPVPGANEVVVGEEMARQLGVSEGDELVVVGSAADGSMANDLYTVRGVFSTGLAEFDAATLVLPIADLQTLLVLDPARIHEIAVATRDPATAAATAARLADALSAAPRGLEVAPWPELNPVLSEYVSLADSTYWIFIVIVFAVASFGIANTMLMATFERRREFAVLLALGATPWSVVASVLAEAAAMGALAVAVGGAVIYPPLAWLHASPLELDWLYGNVTLQGALLTPALRIEPNLPAWTWATVGLVLTALLAALYPALRAARVPPADTLSGA